MKKKDHRKGPKKKTIKDGYNKFVYYIFKGKVELVNKGISLYRGRPFIMTDSQVRSLRNWLTWYLNSK